MLGIIWWDKSVRGISSPERINLAGLTALRVRLAPGGRWEKRRVVRAGRLLARQGVRRVLLPIEFRWRRVLDDCGLASVDPLPLYRAMAPELIFALLTRRGVLAQDACVLLRGQWAQGELAQAAYALCPRVRRLVFDVEGGAGVLERTLYERFGAACWPQEECAPDICVRFDGTPESGELSFSESGVALCGMCLEADVSLPESLERVCVLTALWQTGLLPLGSIRVKTA